MREVKADECRSSDANCGHCGPKAIYSRSCAWGDRLQMVAIEYPWTPDQRRYPNDACNGNTCNQGNLFLRQS